MSMIVYDAPTKELLKKYPPPSKSPRYKRLWATHLKDINHRENLKETHLLQMDILCKLYIEVDELQEEISIHGRTYESVGRNGSQIKIRPEYQMLQRCYSEIKNYSKMLGLVLVKDTSTKDDDAKNEFD